MKVNSNVKTGKITVNHKQAVKGLRVKSGVKAGDGSEGDFKITVNHNQTVKR